MNTSTVALIETRYHSAVKVLATPSTRRVTLLSSSRTTVTATEYTWNGRCNDSQAQASLRHVQTAWQSVRNATRGKTVATRVARSQDSEDILQADGETVKKVTINEASISPTVDTTVKALPEGRCLGGKTSAASRARLNEAFTRTDTSREDLRRSRFAKHQWIVVVRR